MARSTQCIGGFLERSKCSKFPLGKWPQLTNGRKFRSVSALCFQTRNVRSYTWPKKCSVEDCKYGGCNLSLRPYSTHLNLRCLIEHPILKRPGSDDELERLTLSCSAASVFEDRPKPVSDQISGKTRPNIRYDTLRRHIRI